MAIALPSTAALTVPFKEALTVPSTETEPTELNLALANPDISNVVKDEIVIPPIESIDIEFKPAVNVIPVKPISIEVRETPPAAGPFKVIPVRPICIEPVEIKGVPPVMSIKLPDERLGNILVISKPDPAVIEPPVAAARLKPIPEDIPT